MATKNTTPPKIITEEAAREAKQLWDLNCHRIGMKPEDFGKEVILSDITFTICGIRPRSTVKTVEIYDSKKQRVYITSAAIIQRAWNAEGK